MRKIGVSFKRLVSIGRKILVLLQLITILLLADFLMVSPSIAMDDYFYQIPQQLNMGRKQNGLPWLIGDYKQDHITVGIECKSGIKASCKIEAALYKGCELWCKQMYAGTDQFGVEEIRCLTELCLRY